MADHVHRNAHTPTVVDRRIVLSSRLRVIGDAWGSTATDRFEGDTGRSALAARTRSPTHKPHPDPCGDEFDDGEVVGVVFFEARSDGSEMFDLVEEALDEVAISVEEGAKSRDIDPSRHWFDVGPGAALGQRGSQRVAVIGSVGEQNLTGAEPVEQVVGASAIVGL